jgi:hypothetical protein
VKRKLLKKLQARLYRPLEGRVLDVLNDLLLLGDLVGDQRTRKMGSVEQLLFDLVLGKEHIRVGNNDALSAGPWAAANGGRF